MAVVWATGGNGWAQGAGKLETRPHLALAFPFTERQGGVGVKFPVLINTKAVIGPEMILRVMYNPPRADDAEVLALQSSANQEVAYSKLHKLKSEKPLSATEMAVIKISRETHWPVMQMYQLALANLDSKNMRVVWVNPESMDLFNENIELLHGMLIGNKGSRYVDVLAVEKGSRAEAAGIKPGDQIREIAGTAVRGNLLEFARILGEKKRAAELSSDEGVRMVLQDEAGETREVVLKAISGATFNSGVLDVTLDELGGGAVEKPADADADEDKPSLPVIGTWKKKTYEAKKEDPGEE